MVVEEINIIRADKNDAQLLSDLSNVTFIETYRGSCSDNDLIGFIDKCFNEDVIRQELEDPEDFYYIAFADGFPAGYMRLKEDNRDYPLEKKYKALQLKRLYVTKEYQGKKIGAALMNAAIQLAGENGYEILWLGVWEGNDKARSFYDKWGFEDPNLSYSFPVGETIHTDYWLIKFIGKS